MSTETSFFAVGRDNTAYKVLGSDMDSKVKPGDVLLVQRGDNQFKLTIPDPVDVSAVLDDDIFVCTDTEDGETYRVSGSQFKELFKGEFDEDGYRDCINAAAQARARCFLLCETAYCQSICERDYELAISECKIDFNWSPPIVKP